METSTVEGDSPTKTLARMLAKAASLGMVAGLFALGVSTPAAAAGAVFGCLAAGFYSAGYVRSHLNRELVDKVFDSKVARHAFLRLVLVASIGAGSFALLGQPALKTYLLAFLVGFPVLLISEAPRATKMLKARGIIG